MNQSLQDRKHNSYNYPLKILSYLGEQKIGTGDQIKEYCFDGASCRYIWRVLPRLRDAKLIDEKCLHFPGERRRFGFFLTKAGYNELRDQSQLDLEELQIKSNTPYHDIVLNDLRNFFSRINECRYFVSENILKSKILENSIPELAVFRSHRCDSAVLMGVENGAFWLSLEYERTRKSYERYVQRIKNWYQAESLPGVLLVTESESLIQILSEIDRKTLPHLKRKILYISKNNLLSSSGIVQFLNCKKEPLSFTLSNKMKIHFPLLDQSLARSFSKK